jgi:hypothetical protein
MRILKTSVLVAAFVSLASAPLAHAALQAPTPPPHQHPAEQQKPPTPGMQGTAPMDCQAMMASHQKMMEHMKAMDARLDTLVLTMNSATGQAKTDATAAVVAELVTQRKAMREGMEKMQGGMMQHMMGHMQSGGAQGMMNCPMMKNMGGMKH